LIVCLTGTSPYSFDRMIKVVDEIAINHKVFIQIGNSKYIPVNCEFIDFEGKNRLQSRIKDADLIISQGGYGSMMDAIQLQKKVIAVPREEKYRELIGDQRELVKYFESKHYVVGCYDISEIEVLIEKCLDNQFEFKKYSSESEIKVKDVIEEYINNV
jgi:beta-1,4-N-acetylglucosaminyltransferase